MARRGRRAAAVAAAVLLQLFLVSAPANAEPGPPLTEPAGALGRALTCSGDLYRSRAIPVLLVHGTGASGAENWEVGYQPALLRRGHAVCTVDLPNYGFGDVQRSVEYVVAAIRSMHRRAGRRISIIGQSQGGFHPAYALRVWPDLAARVDDFVGLVGVYDRGSEAARSGCAAEGCVPSFQQFATGSALLRELSRRRLPAGPSVTAIGTLQDTTVTPQPAANELPGARSIQVQDLCPGRDQPGDEDHILMAGDAAGFALTMDALTHPGPAEVGRADRGSCAKQFFDDVDYARVGTVLPTVLTRPRTESTRFEPSLRCYMRAACKDVFQRGRMVTAATARRRGTTVRVVVRLQAPGSVRVRIARRRLALAVPPNTSRAVLTLRRVKKGSSLAVETRPTSYTAWARERTVKIRRR